MLCFVFVEHTFFVLYSWNTLSLFCILGTHILCSVFLEHTFFVLYSWNTVFEDFKVVFNIKQCFAMTTLYKTLIYFSLFCYSCMLFCFCLFCSVLFSSVEYKPVCLYDSFQIIWVLYPVYVRLCRQSTYLSAAVVLSQFMLTSHNSLSVCVSYEIYAVFVLFI
jgi:hypothetical protein